MYEAKTKVLVICTFVFAYAKSRISHDSANMKVSDLLVDMIITITISRADTVCT